MSKPILIMMSIFMFYSCGHPNKNQQDVETTSALSDSIAECVYNADSAQTKSLNDIRFDGWSEEDWYDNDYLRELRHYFNQVYEGQITDKRLQPYESLLKSKFTVYKVEPYLLGGLYLQIIFLDAPSRVFEAQVYSYVDESTETIVGYEVRGVLPSDIESHFSREQILELIEEHPEVKLY